MTKYIRHMLTSSIVLLMGACSPNSENPEISETNAKDKSMSNAQLDNSISELMKDNDVKGLAVAIVNGQDISYIRTFGFRNVEKSLPLEKDTIMYGASLTKAAFAYMVLQLVDEGKLDLDTTIDNYLAKPLPEYDRWQSLADNEEWKLLTPRIILSHRTGLHNLRFLEPDRNLTFHFKPGEAYAYSGEGIKILQTVLEEGLGLDVKAEMRARLFDPFEMPNTSLQWRADFAQNLADGYAMDGSFEPHDERSNVSASGSMDTTIADQAKMWRGMLSGKGLSDNMRAEWIQAQFPIRTVQKFPTILMHDRFVDRGEAINLSAGLGVESWIGPKGAHFAKGGHNDWTGNLVICQETEKRCLIMLANSVRAEIIFPDIVEMVLGDTGYPWWWTYPSLHIDR